MTISYGKTYKVSLSDIILHKEIITSCDSVNSSF